MFAPAHHGRLYTFAEYVALEEYSNVKHEFFGGQIYAMAGGTREHGFLSGNLIMALGAQFVHRGCFVGTSNVRVVISATGLATYPDASVFCGPIEHEPADRDSLTNPVLLVEVTGDSTEHYDRGEKWEHYQTIPSLRAFLLVSQRARRVTLFTRRDDGAWAQSDVIERGDVVIPQLECRVSLDDIYRGVLPPAA